MKKVLFFSVFLFTCLSVFGQSIHNKTIERVVNDIILYQTLNNFNHNVPLFLVSPGFVFVGNFSFQSNPLLLETDFESQMTRLSPLKHFHRDITESLEEPFLPYIPRDSAMTVHFIHDKKLLFEMTFAYYEDTLVFTQKKPGGEKVKTLKYVNGHCVSTSFIDERQRKRYKDELLGDTLRVISSESYQHAKFTTEYSKIRYRANLPVFMQRSKTIADISKIDGETHFVYDEINRLVDEKTYNRRGRLRSSVKYFYKDDRLIQVERSGSKAFSIDFTYDDNGLLQEKIYISRDKEYLTKYSAEINKSREISFFSKEGNPVSYRFSISPDVRQHIMELVFAEMKNDQLRHDSYRRWLLDYEQFGNLSTIRMLNYSGTILKEIIIEYSFYQP